MTISIIIPVKDDAVRLGRCLASIASNQPATGIDVIVADNGSADDSTAVAAAAGARVVVLPHVGVSALRNAAAAQAGGDVLAFIDADHEIAPSWLEAVADVMADARTGAAGALYTAPSPGTWVQHMYGLLRGRTAGRAEVEWLGSGNLAVRRTAFAAVDGFDTDLEACEDVDLCQRLRLAGWSVVGDERLASVHHGDPPTLAALFRAERWRGRDNLRVSLRGRVTARSMPGILAPIVTLAGVSLAVLGSVAWALGLLSARVPLIGLAAFAAPIVVRATLLAGRGRQVSPLFLVRALAVAATYELARGVALVGRAPHHRQARASAGASRSH